MSARGTAELAADNNITKYNNLSVGYSFVPLAFETLDPLNKDGDEFLNILGKMAGGCNKRPTRIELFEADTLHLSKEE